MVTPRRVLGLVSVVCLSLAGLIFAVPAAQAVLPPDTPPPVRPKIITMASAELTSKSGIQYVWAGGHASKPGPSKGSCSNYEGPLPCKDNTLTGLDCSGYVRWVLTLAGLSDFGGGITANGFYTSSRLHSVSESAAQQGDLIFFGTSGHATHVAIYAGNGYMYEASGHAHDIIYRLVAGSGHDPKMGYRSLF